MRGHDDRDMSDEHTQWNRKNAKVGTAQADVPRPVQFLQARLRRLAEHRTQRRCDTECRSRAGCPLTNGRFNVDYRHDDSPGALRTRAGK